MQRRLPFDELPEPTKRCSSCKVVKPLSEFHKNRTSRDGVQSYCRECNIAEAKRYHAENLEHCRARIARRARVRRDELQGLLYEFLACHPCTDCGECDPVVLDFDHVAGDKVANVSALVFALKPWEVVMAEIAKCEVVCANCHRRRTAERLRSFRLRRRQTPPGNLGSGA